MSLSRQEIVDFALRYLTPEEVVDFPVPGDLFSLFQRALPANKILKDDEGWQFAGYCLCREYVPDDEAKPAGKWIWHRFVSLSVYPPFESMLKLQPPHIAKGLFQNPERTFEYKIIKVALDKIPAFKGGDINIDTQVPAAQDAPQAPTNILQFPVHKTRSKKPSHGNNGNDGAA
jgi:hypothetical protein